MERTLKVRLLSDSARPPKRATEGAAGYDLYSAYHVEVPAHGKALIPLDIAISVPDGHYGRIAPRSGLSVIHGLNVGAGVIDGDFTGNVKVLLFNHSDKDYLVPKGERIAQLILEQISHFDVHLVDSLDATKRGDSGFGSTGKAQL